MFKNLIFDWSGTLVDDLNLTLDASNYVFAQYGKETLNREAFREEFQLPYPDYYARVLPEADLEELENHFRKAFTLSSETVEVLPHARDFMDFCMERSIRCFALTSVDAKEFDIQCKELGMFDYFEAIHAGIRHKNEHIHALLEQHGLSPEETAFIGDMQHDIQTAKHGGITSIGVLTGYNSPSQLAAAEPDIIVPDLNVLLRLFKRLPDRSEAIDDKILIKGLELNCHIGVPDEERQAPQRLLADIVLQMCRPLCHLNDDLSRTIDYHVLSRQIIDIASSHPRKLIETLAGDIADFCSRQPGLAQARVRIRKFILPDTEYVAAEVTRSHSGQ